MANFDNIGDYSLGQILTRRLTTPGGAVAPTVAPELFPVIALENDRPEWGHLKGEGLYGTYISIAALAANYGMCQFYLPTNARSVAVINSISVNNANATALARLVGISGGLGGWTAVTTKSRDTRRNGNGGALIVESNQNVAQPSTFGLVTQFVAAQQSFNQPLVIGPGGSFCLFTAAVNQALQFNITWYERQAEPGELI